MYDEYDSTRFLFFLLFFSALGLTFFSIFFDGVFLAGMAATLV